MKRSTVGIFVALFLFVLGLSFLVTATSAQPNAKKDKSTAAKSDTKKPDAKKEEPLPLKPDRKIEFITDEGTWLSLDVSPDGQTIVFDLIGDLYSVPVAGGEAKKLTSGMAFNGQPTYSPDGKKIAFTSDRGGSENVWIADADGTNPKQLSHDEQSEFASPAWTPDGNYVIAARTTQFPIGASELWMYHVKGEAAYKSRNLIPSPTPDHASGPIPLEPRPRRMDAIFTMPRAKLPLVSITSPFLFHRSCAATVSLAMTTRSPTLPAAPCARLFLPMERNSCTPRTTKLKPGSASVT